MTNYPDALGAEQECDRLRVRLAEAEAERASTEHAWNNALYDVLAEKTRATAAEARLAEVEAERDAKHERILEVSRLSLGFEARLADVLALCDTTDEFGTSLLSTSEVRAAATGDDDRG